MHSKKIDTVSLRDYVVRLRRGSAQPVHGVGHIDSVEVVVVGQAVVIGLNGLGSVGLCCRTDHILLRSAGRTNIWGFPKIRGTILRVPILKILKSWGPYWGLPILGNYHIRMRVRSGSSELEPRGRMKFVESLRVREHAAGHSANQRIEEHVNNLAGWLRDCGSLS